MPSALQEAVSDTSFSVWDTGETYLSAAVFEQLLQISVSMPALVQVAAVLLTLTDGCVQPLPYEYDEVRIVLHVFQ